MPEFMTLVCECIVCQAVFTCSPTKVPSLRVNGKREPLCRACFDEWNAIHRTHFGLAPATLMPGAYEGDPA